LIPGTSSTSTEIQNSSSFARRFPELEIIPSCSSNLELGITEKEGKLNTGNQNIITITTQYNSIGSST